MTIRKNYDSNFKARVVLETLKNQRTIAEIASEYGIHANQITKWKRQVLDELHSIFSDKHERIQKDSETIQAELYRQIGQLKVEMDWLKKSRCSQLSRNDLWSNQRIVKYLYTDSVNFWICHALGSTTNRQLNLNITCF